MVAAIAEKKKVQWSCGNHFPAILANAATTIAEIGLFLSQSFLSQTLMRLFQLAQCWQIFLELSKRLYWSLGKKKKVVFCSRLPQDREIRHFHVVVVQRRQWNKQKRVIHVQSCCFANLNLFWRSRCRRRRLCLSSFINLSTALQSNRLIASIV